MGSWTSAGSDIYYTDGNVGIGTTAPNAGAKLHVNGGILTTSALASTSASVGGMDYSLGTRFFSVGASGSTKGTFAFIAKGADDSAATRLGIDANGALRLNAYTTPGVLVNDASGNITSSQIGQYVYVRAFGATGDGTTNDSAAINAAFAYAKSLGGNVKPILSFAGDPTKMTFRIQSTLNFAHHRNLGMIVDFANAILLGDTAGGPVIDALDSVYLTFRDGYMHGNSSTPPTYGIQIGRGISGNEAANNAMINMLFTGAYTQAAVINVGSEVFLASKCKFWNERNDAHCYVGDARNQSHITSPYFTVTQPWDSERSFNDQLFLGCNFENIGSPAGKTGKAIKLVGRTNAHRFVNCYAQNSGGQAIELWYDHNALDLDIHCEAIGLTHVVYCKSSAGAMALKRFKLNEYYSFAAAAVIGSDITAANSVSFFDSEVNIAESYANTQIFGAGTSGGTINFNGRLSIGSGQGQQHNLSNLWAFTGDVFCFLPSGNIVWPSIKRARLVSFGDGSITNV
jgi:hypothetical protein